MYGLDFTDQLCSGDNCYPTGSDGSRRYRDEHHLAPRYATTLWKSFSYALAKQMTLPPSSVDKIRAKTKKQRFVIQWKKSLPGSGAKPKYKVSFKPKGEWKYKAKKYICESEKTKCKSGYVPIGSKYKVRAIAKNLSGKSPARVKSVKAKR